MKTLTISISLVNIGNWLYQNRGWWSEHGVDVALAILTFLTLLLSIIVSVFKPIFDKRKLNSSTLLMMYIYVYNERQPLSDCQRALRPLINFVQEKDGISKKDFMKESSFIIKDVILQNTFSNYKKSMSRLFESHYDDLNGKGITNTTYLLLLTDIASEIFERVLNDENSYDDILDFYNILCILNATPKYNRKLNKILKNYDLVEDLNTVIQ